MLSLDGEGGWAVYPGMRGEEGAREEEAEALQLASSGSLGAPGASRPAASIRTSGK